MRLSSETKKMYVEFFTRSAEIVFGLVVIGPFIAGGFSLQVFGFGVFFVLFFLLLGSGITQSLREVNS